MKRFIIGLAGTHGTGKTTLLQAAKAKGIPVDESQLSRTAQTLLGWESLKPAQESQENMWALQDAILEAMSIRDSKINASGIATLVDRTPADVWGYTHLWITRLGADKVDADRIRDYYQKCFTLATAYRVQIIVPIREEIPFVEQPNRADVQSRLFHARTVDDFIFGNGFEHCFIRSLSVEDRVNDLLSIMYKDMIKDVTERAAATLKTFVDEVTPDFRTTMIEAAESWLKKFPPAQQIIFRNYLTSSDVMLQINNALIPKTM